MAYASTVTHKSYYLEENRDARRRLIRTFLPISQFLIPLPSFPGYTHTLDLDTEVIIGDPIESLQNPLTITIRAHLSLTNNAALCGLTLVGPLVLALP